MLPNITLQQCVSVQGTGLAATDPRSGARSGEFGAERLTKSFPKE